MSDLLHFILGNERAFTSLHRVNALYSDFSQQRTSNPDGFYANVETWRSALIHAGQKGLLPGNGILSMHTGPVLEQALDGGRKLGRPVGIGVVIEESIAEGVMIPLQQYLQATSSIYQKGWFASLRVPKPWEILAWGAQQLGLGKLNDRKSGDVVLLFNLEEASNRIAKHMNTIESTLSSRIFTLPTFTKTFADVLGGDLQLSASDITIVLLHLTRDKQIASMRVKPSQDLSQPAPTTIIKFSPSSTFADSNCKAEPVDENDITIANLKNISDRLQQQVESLVSRAVDLETAARKAISLRVGAVSSISESQRKQAIALLRQKKLVESTLDKRRESQLQIETVLMSINEAADNITFVNAIEESNKTLKDLHRQIGGVERVEKVMDEMYAQKADIHDVQRIITDEALASGAVVDETELDDEIEALEQEAERKKAEEGEKERQGKDEKLLSDAPTVPSTEPVKEQQGDSTLEDRLSDLSLKVAETS